MKRLLLLAIFGLLLLAHPAGAAEFDDSPVCVEIGELMHGDQKKCKKGDVIMVNPMMAAFLCDLTLPNISGEKTVVCHYLGKKRAERKVQK